MPKIYWSLEGNSLSEKYVKKNPPKQVHKFLVEKFVQIIANYCKLKNEVRFEIILHW